MESSAHRELKHAGARFLRNHFRCIAVATEVRSPIPRHRIDAAGYHETSIGGSSAGAQPGTIFIEAKCSRADFLRDSSSPTRLLAERARLESELACIEREYIHPCEPHLQESGHFLFSHMHPWRLDDSASHCRRVLLRELRRIDAALYSHTKFFLLAKWRLAGRLFILAPRGLIEPAELPASWGLLALGSDGVVAEVHPAALLNTPPRRVTRTLRAIAIAATSAALGPMVVAPAPAATPALAPERSLAESTS